MRKIKQTLEKALIEAAKVIKKAADQPISIEYKSPVSLVTETDKKAERVIIEIIKKQFPDHSILAEESGESGTESGTGSGRDRFLVKGSKQNLSRSRTGTIRTKCKWIIDPVDGTTNFAHRVPAFCISIGFEEDGIMKLGGVFNPLLDEWFWAERGKGASLNGKKIKVSKVKTLAESLLATGFPYDRRERARYYLKFIEEFMLKTHGIRRLGSSAIDLCYVACGRFDGYWEFNLQAWDQSAGALIVEEAGGRLSNFTGGPMSIYGKQTLASNGKIHGEMLAIIKKLL